MMGQIKPPQAEALALMSKAAEKKKSSTQLEQPEDYFKPKLCLALKLEVSKHPLVDRDHAQEVAEVLEEMLAFVDDRDGEPVNEDQHLPARQRRAPGKTMNEAKLKKQEELKREVDLKAKDDEKRKKRKEELKQELLKFNEQKAKDEVEVKQKNEGAKAKEAQAKKKSDEETKKRSDELKKIIEDTKKAKIDEELKKRADEEAKAKVETDKRKAGAKEFMKLQKGRLVKEFE